MARKRKGVDTALILKLRSTGLTYRQVAEEYLKQTGVKISPTLIYFRFVDFARPKRRPAYPIKGVGISGVLNKLKGYKELTPLKIRKSFRRHGLDTFCFVCRMAESGIIQIHHIDEDRGNNSPDNLALLCPNCHMRIHHNGLIISKQTHSITSWGFETKQNEPRTAPFVSKQPAPPASSFAMPTNTTPASPSVRSELPQFGSAHHIAYSVRYSGTQPLNSVATTYGYNNTNVCARFEGDGYVIQAHKYRLVVWVSGITGDNSLEIASRSKGKARSVLGAFALQRGLVVDWKTFTEKSEPHYNLDDDRLNEVLIPIIAAGGDKAKQAGILPGDASHPDQVEFTGIPGKQAYDRLGWLLNDFPQDWKAEREVVKEFAINIKSHMAAINEIRDTLKEMRNYYKEMRSKG